MRTRNDTGGTGSHFAPLRFMFAGVAIAAALLAVVFAGCALAGASSLQPYYDQYLTPRLAVVHKNSTQNLFAGTMSAAEAAQAMAAEGR